MKAAGVSLFVAARHTKVLGYLGALWASAGPLAFLTQGQGDSPEKQAPVRSVSPENCSLIKNWKGCLSSSAWPGEELLTGPDL